MLFQCLVSVTYLRAIILNCQLAQKELQKINMYKAPREKLACILNCCKVITNLLHNAAVAANENSAGADDFLPVLIYVTLKVSPTPPSLVSPLFPIYVASLLSDFGTFFLKKEM